MADVTVTSAGPREFEVRVYDGVRETSHCVASVLVTTEVAGMDIRKKLGH